MQAPPANEVTDLLSMLGPPPHVIKLNEGTQGAGVMLTENDEFRPSARSKVGAMGLMQIMPRIWIPNLGPILGREELEAGQIQDSVQAAVCFADLVGFTRLGGEVELEELGSVAGGLAAIASGLLNAHGRFALPNGIFARLLPSEQNLAHLDAFHAGGGRIEVLGITRVLTPSEQAEAAKMVNADDVVEPESSPEALHPPLVTGALEQLPVKDWIAP